MNTTAMQTLDYQAKRMGIGTVLAIGLHGMLLVWLVSSPLVSKIKNIDLMSVPTNVSIRFVSPVPKVAPPAPSIEKVVPIQKQKPIVKKIKAKSAPVVEKTTKAPPKPSQKIVTSEKPASPTPIKPTTIPVISEAIVVGKRVTPKYPKAALRMKQEGEVLLHVLISETGERLDIKTHKPSQYASLNRAAINAVKKWTFKPYKSNGNATKSWVEIPIEFRIQ